MRNEEFKALLNYCKGPQSFNGFMKLFDGPEIQLNAVQESMLFYSAIAQFSIPERVVFNSHFTVVDNPTVTKLLVELFKLQDKIGTRAVSQVKEMLLNKP